MAENRNGTTARGNNKKVRKQKKAPSQGVPQDAATSETAAPQAAAKKAAGRKKAAPKRTAKKAAPKGQVSAEERYQMIQEAAYFQAEKEGFDCDPWKCWLAAEAEIDARLAGSR
jgi:hypothetical protein